MTPMNFQMPLAQNFRQLGGQQQPTFGQNPPMHLGGLMMPPQTSQGRVGGPPPAFGGMWGGQPPMAGPFAPNAPSGPQFGGMWGSQPPMGNPGMLGGPPSGGQWWGGQPPMGNPVHPQPIFGGMQPPSGIDLSRMVNPQGNPQADIARQMMGNFGYGGGR